MFSYFVCWAKDKNKIKRRGLSINLHDGQRHLAISPWYWLVLMMIELQFCNYLDPGAEYKTKTKPRYESRKMLLNQELGSR